MSSTVSIQDAGAGVIIIPGDRYFPEGVTVAKDGTFFFSNGYAWGTCTVKKSRRAAQVELSIMHGEITLSEFILRDLGRTQFERSRRLAAGGRTKFRVRK